MLLAVAPAIIVAPVIIIAPVVRIAIKLEISTVAVISLYISRELAVSQSIVVNYNITTLIKKSDIDVSVAMLQAALKYKGYNPRWVDGEFGAQTGAALKAFQADHGLDADTICGKATWNEITKA